MPEMSIIRDGSMCKNLLNVIIQTTVNQFMYKFTWTSE